MCIAQIFYDLEKKELIFFFTKEKKDTPTKEMRASSDSWRGASTDRQRRSSVDATSKTPSSGGGTQKVQKHQCLFAACVPAKECGPEEVKCVPHSSNWCSLGTDCALRSDFCVVG